jgi:hypothetical protein
MTDFVRVLLPSLALSVYAGGCTMDTQVPDQAAQLDWSVSRATSGPAPDDLHEIESGAEDTAEDTVEGALI